MGNAMQIKLVAIDLDGTLLDDERKVPQSTVDVIREVSKRGARVILASARPACAILPYVEQLGINDPIVSLSGARIVYPDETVVAEKPLERAVYRTLIDDLTKRDCYVKVYGRNHLYVQKATDETLRFSKNFAIPYTEMAGQSLAEAEEAPFRIFLCDLPKAALPELLSLVRANFPLLTAIKSDGNGIEILANDVNKGAGVENICALYGISMKDNVMAVGNEGSDISMVVKARWGVAVANACAPLLEVADEVTKRNTELGVEHILRKYILNC